MSRYRPRSADGWLRSVAGDETMVSLTHLEAAQFTFISASSDRGIPEKVRPSLSCECEHSTG